MLICINGIYHARWKDCGRLRSLSLRTRDEKTARRIHDGIMLSIVAERERRKLARAMVRFGLATTAQKLEAGKPLETLDALSPTLPRLLVLARKRREFSGEVEQEWGRMVNRVGVKRADELSPRLIVEYLDEKFGKCSAKRWNNVRSMLAGVFTAAMPYLDGVRNPFHDVPQRRADKTKVRHYGAFNEADVPRILAACDGYWRCLAMISSETGLRLESCRRLCPAMISGGVIEILPGKTARFGRAVRIPVSRRLGEFLGGIDVDAERPFCSAFPSTNRYPGHPNEPYFKGMLEELGIYRPGLCFHSLRDTFVSRMRAAGMDDAVLRGIVGHASQEMTDLYDHGTEKAVAEMRRIEEKEKSPSFGGAVKST